ncbi:uncharacterized protein LOC116299007 [Actinia tenebrosa]|uniref:Uncharacterized protein LOC116299007 n=1 Tax=Actinia tenebrosa TaxID=6105 RepID=A0A6P8I692_ACTTE|nr:uncharacterized protein LOC116299007 [Actinia tenebrosa]
MAEKTRPKSRQNEEERTKEQQENVLELNIVYKGKDFRLSFSLDADKQTICKEIKRQTGVKGAFYLHYGDSSNNYLHSSSLTLANISKLSGSSLEVRGGDWINKGGDSIWYYFSQTLKPNVQERLTRQQWVPFDNPP